MNACFVHLVGVQSFLFVINVVQKGKALEKQIRKGQIPMHILIKLQDWVEDVQLRGLEEVRKIPGHHDEPCVGMLRGYRSIRLGRGWRAYYTLRGEVIRFVLVERVDKHEYGK